MLKNFFEKFLFVKPSPISFANNLFANRTAGSNYRDNVCIIIKNKEDKFLVVNDVRGFWGFVQGGVEKHDKSKTEAAFRELKEEIGFNKRDVSLVGFSKIEHKYNWAYVHDGHCGQKQSFCLMKLNKDKKVVLGKNELDNFLWVDFDELGIFFRYSLRKHNKVLPKIVDEFPSFFKKK